MKQSLKHTWHHLSVMFVVRGELPDQIKTKLFGFSVDTAEQVRVMVCRQHTRTHSGVRTHTGTHIIIAWHGHMRLF